MTADLTPAIEATNPFEPYTEMVRAYGAALMRGESTAGVLGLNIMEALAERDATIAQLRNQLALLRQSEATAAQHAQQMEARAAEDRHSAAAMAEQLQRERARWKRHLADEHPILPSDEASGTTAGGDDRG